MRVRSGLKRSGMPDHVTRLRMLSGRSSRRNQSMLLEADIEKGGDLPSFQQGFVQK